MAFLPQSFRESVDLLFAVFEALPDPVFVKNSDHKWVYGNQAFCNLIGIADPVGKGDEEIFPADQIEVFHAHDRRVFAGETTINEEQIGDDLYALTKKTPIQLPDGSIGLVALIMDITRYKEAEAKAKTAEAENLAKSQFLANMSHEIRTPLNGVMGMAQALKQDDLTQDQEEKVDLLIESGRTLLTVVNDVLDISKINAGKMTIEPVDTEMQELLRSVVELFRPTAQEKQLDLRYNIDTRVPERLRIDAVRVRQCVSNLTSNALKFTDRGSISLDLRMLPADGNDLLEIAVTDTGVGMNDDQVSRLFSEFSQVDDSSTRRFSGTGLGLAISRKLAQLMGGDLTVESAPGIGSTFRLTIGALPAHETAATAAAKPAAIGNLTGRRVLIADDNAINRRVIRLLLTPLGVELDEAENGAEAIRKLEAADFDAVLMDVQMPVMDGVEAVSAIRASDEHWAPTPIVMLTANAMPGDSDRYLAAGADGYLAKPVEVNALITAITVAIQRHTRVEAA